MFVCTQRKKVLGEKGQLLNLFLGWADSEPSSPVRLKNSWVVVVVQLVERLLPTPEIRSSNPDIGIILSTYCIILKTKLKKKRPGMAHLLKAKELHASAKSIKILETFLRMEAKK